MNIGAERYLSKKRNQTMKLREIATLIIAERAKYNSLIFNHWLQESLFRNSLNEEADTDKREDVL
jgi:hypothetical protein